MIVFCFHLHCRHGQRQTESRLDSHRFDVGKSNQDMSFSWKKSKAESECRVISREGFVRWVSEDTERECLWEWGIFFRESETSFDHLGPGGVHFPRSFWGIREPEAPGLWGNQLNPCFSVGSGGGKRLGAGSREKQHTQTQRRMKGMGLP